MKLGKTPATHDYRDLCFSTYRAGPLPPRPKVFGHEGAVASWGMLGNDTVGDCVFAGAAHETILWTTETGHPAPFTAASVLSDYSAVTGYDPTDPNSDQGTDVRTALKYRAKTGLLDATGKRHRIGAYVRVSGRIEIEEAVYLFGAAGVGIQFPSSAMDQFNAGRPWSIVSGSPLEGGHYVPLVALRGDLYCVTWGKLQPLTRAFLTKYCDEAWAILSPEMLTGGKSLEGFDLAQLQADLKAL